LLLFPSAGYQPALSAHVCLLDRRAEEILRRASLAQDDGGPWSGARSSRRGK
jgi:hypothetical protein